MDTYPHTIENGAGETLTFLGKVPGAAGERLEIENVVQPGAGPPMHVHKLQEEALTVERGRIGYQRPGEPEQFAGPGERVVFAPGEAHRFWNAGEDELVARGYVEPADNLEYYLTAMFDSMRENGGGRPRAMDAAFLSRRYRSEFAMSDIPAPVQAIVFPILAGLGRILGRFRKYAGAPEPISR